MKRLPSFGLQSQTLKERKLADSQIESNASSTGHFGLFQPIIYSQKESQPSQKDSKIRESDKESEKKQNSISDHDLNANSNSCSMFREITANFFTDLESKHAASKKLEAVPVKEKETISPDDLSIKKELTFESDESFEWIIKAPFEFQNKASDITIREKMPMIYTYERPRVNFAGLKNFEEQSQSIKKDDFVMLFLSLFEEYQKNSARIFYIFNRLTAMVFFHHKGEPKKTKHKKESVQKSSQATDDACYVLISSEKDIAGTLKANLIDYTELNEQIKVEDPLEKENIEIEKELHSANIGVRRDDDEFLQVNLKRQLILVKRKHINMLVQYIINDFHSEEAFQLIANFPFLNCVLATPKFVHQARFVQQLDGRTEDKTPIGQKLASLSVFQDSERGMQKINCLKVTGPIPAQTAKEIYEYLKSHQNITDFNQENVQLSVPFSKSLSCFPK